MLLRPAFALVLAILTATVSAHAETPQLLRLHWEPAKTYTLEIVTESTSHKAEKDEAGQTMKVIQTTTMGVRKDSDTGERNVEIKFVGIRGLISAGGKSMAFDSDKPKEASPMLQQAFGRAVGKSFLLVYDDQDRFIDIRGLASLASSSGAVTGLTALADSRNVASLFRKSLEIGLPSGAVSVGDKWTADETMTFPQAGDTHVEMNGKFEAIEERDGRKHARVAFEGNLLSVARKDKPTSAIEIAKGSTMSGVVYFDLERRTVDSSAYTTALKMDVGGQVLAFEQHVTTRMMSIEDTK